jgi:hypothetical protein
MLARLATPKDTAKTNDDNDVNDVIDATDLVESCSRLLPAIAFHPAFNTPPTDLNDPKTPTNPTKATIFDSPEFKSFRASESLVCRVNPQISRA